MNTCNNPKCKHKIAAINIKTGLCEFCHMKLKDYIASGIYLFCKDQGLDFKEGLELYNKLKIV